MVPTCTKKQLNKKKKKRESKLPFGQDLVMAPTCTQKKKAQNKEKDVELKLPFYGDLAMVPQKQQNKWKKGEQAPFLPNLGDGILKTTKIN